MPQKPERENLEVEQECGPASRPCKLVFTACKQMKNRGTKCTFILTHGHAKLVPHWIPQFHHIFTSLASLKMKTDKRFSCVFVQIWRRAKAKLINNKLANYSDKKHRIKNSSRERLFHSPEIARAAIHTTLDNWRWILIRDDRNLSLHCRGLMRFKNGFSLLSQKVKRLFLPFFCEMFVSVFSFWPAKKIVFSFFVKIHLPWYLYKLTQEKQELWLLQ